MTSLVSCVLAGLIIKAERVVYNGCLSPIPHYAQEHIEINIDVSLELWRLITHVQNTGHSAEVTTSYHDHPC